MRYNGVNLLRLTIKIDGLHTIFVAAGTEFFLLVWLLSDILLGLLLEYFALFRGVTGAMQRERLFRTVWLIHRMSCIIFITLAGSALLGVGWRGSFSYLKFPAMTGTFGFWPVGIFKEYCEFNRILPQSPCVKTSCMYPWRSFPQNQSPVDRLVLPTRWERCGVESCLVLLAPSSWRLLNLGWEVGSCLVTPVVRWIFS